MKYAINAKRLVAARSPIPESVSKMRISVVTVCYNAENTIRDTIESVINQVYGDFEYVVMDGASSDGTMDIINEYKGNDHLICYSEPDSGLYDAMNKSLDRISGDYVIFMNSGDMFYDDHVLGDIAPGLKSDIVYGDAYKRRKDGDYTEKYKGTHFERMKMMLFGAFFCHQTQFTKTEVMRRYGFREDHRITADYDFLVRTLAGKCSFGHVDRIICSFDENDGISAQKSNYLQMIKEDDTSIRECFPFLYYLTIIPKTIFRIIFRPEY